MLSMDMWVVELGGKTSCGVITLEVLETGGQEQKAPCPH